MFKLIPEAEVKALSKRRKADSLNRKQDVEEQYIIPLIDILETASMMSYADILFKFKTLYPASKASQSQRRKVIDLLGYRFSKKWHLTPLALEVRNGKPLPVALAEAAGAPGAVQSDTAPPQLVRGATDATAVPPIIDTTTFPPQLPTNAEDTTDERRNLKRLRNICLTV
jgi:hypothetical protein